MNPLDQSLWRLLQAAAQAPKPEPEPLPFTVEARVLAQWRARAMEDEFAWLAAMFRRAVICASAVMVLSIVWSDQEKPSAAAGVMELANYEINAHLPP